MANKGKRDLKGGMFLIESIIFLSVQALGLYVGYSLISAQGYVTPTETSAPVISFLLAFLVATILLLLLLKFFKGRVMFKILMAFLIFVGAETVFSVQLPGELALLIAIEFVLIRFVVPNILTQDIVMGVAIAGIGASLGILLSIPAVLVILAVLCVYDVIAVYRTKHMLTMFKGMVKRGMPLSIIVPEHIKKKEMKAGVDEAPVGTGRFIMLGTGDIAFPLIFAVSALNINLISAIAVVIGAFVGLFSIHLLLITKKTGAIPALPPITFFSLIFFMFALLYTGVI